MISQVLGSRDFRFSAFVGARTGGLFAEDYLKNAIRCAPYIYFSRRGFGGTSLFPKKRGSPKFFAVASLHLRQAAGQGFGVGEEGLDCGVS